MKPHYALPLVTGLWIGDTLPPLAELCIRSYLAHGVNFQLFVYQKYDNIPTGTILRDANEILEQSQIFYHETGSLAPFADWFRSIFLFEKGGFWTDMDVACLSADIPTELPWFAAQEEGLIAVGVIGFPAQHPLIGNMCDLAEDPSRIMPWDSPNIVKAKQTWERQSSSALQRRQRAPWGTTGPEGFTNALKYYNLFESSAAVSSIYPIHYSVWRHCYDGMYQLDSPKLAHSWAIHLWAELLRREPDALEHVHHNSIVGQLMSRYLSRTNPCMSSKLNSPRQKKPQIVVGICSCVSMKNRRDAIRQTWLRHSPSNIICKFFLGSNPLLEGDGVDTIILDSPDDYEHLPKKVFDFFRYALENYEFDWLFKCDDDTYLALDRLEELIDSEYELIGDIALEKRGAPSGGAGYLMARSLVEKIVECQNVPETGSEDLVFGALSQHLGARCLASRRLQSDKEPFPQRDNDIITAHWCDPRQLKRIDSYYAATIVATYHGIHDLWRDLLFFYVDGTFMRVNNGDSGVYKVGVDSLELHWHDWGDDVLQRETDRYRNTTLTLIREDDSLDLSELYLPHQDSISNGDLTEQDEAAVMKAVLICAPGETLEGAVEMRRLGYAYQAYPTSQDVDQLEDSRCEEFISFLGFNPKQRDLPYARSLRISFVKMLRDPQFNDDDLIIFGESDATPTIEAKRLKPLLQEWVDSHPEVDVFRLFHNFVEASSACTRCNEISFVPYKVYSHTLDCPYVWGTHALVIPIAKREKLAKLFSTCYLPVDTTLEATQFLKEIDLRICSLNAFYQKKRTHAADKTQVFSHRQRKIALCLSSYKRFEDLQRQIYSMMQQSYENYHLFVAVKGISEPIFQSILCPEFKKFIDEGKLTMRFFPNKNQLANFLDTIRGLDISDYDLFLKIDDDDFYSPDYIKTVNVFHSEIPQHHCSHFAGKSRVLRKSKGYSFLDYEYYEIFGASMALTQPVILRLMDCEKNPRLIAEVTQRYGGEGAHSNFGFAEDKLLLFLMKENGYSNIASYLQRQKIEHHIIVQTSNVSVTRGHLSNQDFIDANTMISDAPMIMESIIELQHSAWRDSVVIMGNQACRLSNHEAATVILFTSETLVLEWESKLKETYKRQANACYQLIRR